MKRIIKIVHSGVVIVLLGISGTASAALQEFSFAGTVAGKDPEITDIDIGDRFTITMTIEDSVTDTNGSVGAGTFPGLITAFSISADAGNTGSWLPSGTPDLPASNFVTNAFGDNFTFQVHATGNPDGGTGWSFHDYDMNFSWPDGITDNGTGDTFAEQMGAPVSIPPAIAGSIAIRFTDGDFSFPAAELMLDPPPTTPVAPTGVPVNNPYVLTVLVLLMGLFGWRATKSKA